ncbi:MAG TPA: hypothetical protein PLP81_07425 [Saprospiraceae bacterium]|nr:hypothetical protein [Chitinophagaceae bacterium]HNA41905.1 hypothetical protein [Saprospiraceae bacterium]HNO71169.1 hypothetical protein [Bacteroidia bacterium]
MQQIKIQAKVLIAIAAFTMFIYSCKKADLKPPETTPAAASDAKARIVQAIKARYGNISAGYIVNINKEATESFYRNTAGLMVRFQKNKSVTGNNIVCNYNCSNTSNPADLHLVYTLSYVQRNYKCENIDKSDLNVSWTISVPFTPLTTFGFNTSTGTLKVTDPGSTLHTYSNLTIAIRTIGADPYCSANTLYEITYKAEQIPDSYFGSGMLIDAALNLYNNCSIVGNLINTGDVAAPDISLYGDLPCYRVEKVWINPPGGGTSYATAGGCYNLCSNPGGFTSIDNHQLEYRKVTSGSSFAWDDQSSTIYWGKNTTYNANLPNLGPYQVSNLENMVSGDTWLVRYRNVKNSICDIIDTNNPGANWGNQFFWIVEIWPL